MTSTNDQPASHLRRGFSSYAFCGQLLIHPFNPDHLMCPECVDAYMASTERGSL